MIFFKILEYGLVDLSSLCGSLNIVDDEKKIDQIKKYIKIWIKEGVVIKDDNHFKISDNYKSTWSRIRKLVDTLGK